MLKSYFVFLSLNDVLVISHMVSVNEMMCPSRVYLHGPKWKLGVGELYSINMVLSKCGGTRFLFIANKVGFAWLSLSEVS